MKMICPNASECFEDDCGHINFHESDDACPDWCMYRLDECMEVEEEEFITEDEMEI